MFSCFLCHHANCFVVALVNLSLTFWPALLRKKHGTFLSEYVYYFQCPSMRVDMINVSKHFTISTAKFVHFYKHNKISECAISRLITQLFRRLLWLLQYYCPYCLPIPKLNKNQLYKEALITLYHTKLNRNIGCITAIRKLNASCTCT